MKKSKTPRTYRIDKLVAETIIDVLPLALKLKAEILSTGGTIEDFRKAIDTIFDNVRNKYKL